MIGLYHFGAGALLALILPSIAGTSHVVSLVVMGLLGFIWFKYLQPFILWNQPCEYTPRSEKVRVRRHKTYPLPVPNTWYHLLDSDEVKRGKVHHLRCLGKSFAVWRTKGGKPVVMDATCPHQGANLAVGGKVKDDCITCPFHSWSFDANGNVVDIPYLDDDAKLPSAKVITYPAQDWCGLLCVYFHADRNTLTDDEPEFKLPSFVQERIKPWKFLSGWDIGNLQLLPTDWVDQAGDHSHFQVYCSNNRYRWYTVQTIDTVGMLFGV
jgi:cholesterol 7-dehydrogenase